MYRQHLMFGIAAWRSCKRTGRLHLWKDRSSFQFMASSQAPSTSNTEEVCGIEQTVHDVDDEDECRLRKMIALYTIKAAACGVNLTAGSLADSVIRLGNGERAAAQEFFGRILPAIKDQRQECSDQRQGCSDQRQGCSGHRSKLH